MSEIIFKTINNKFFVEIDSKLINDIKIECIKAKNNETGGILIGYYSEDQNVAIISRVTGPPKDSKHGKFFFRRGINGLMSIINKEWSLGQYYLGEWHFHPNSSSTPSIVDNIQMKKFLINKSLKCPEPILLIVGGNQHNGWELSVHVYTKNCRLTLLKES